MKGTVLLIMVTVLFCLLLFSTSQIIAQDFCKGNFDYDQDVDGTDAAVFKENFGRSTFKNPCPQDGPAPVAKTGQNTDYATGDDGDLEKGVAWPNQRFTDNSDGTITDNLTGLIWLKDANCIGARVWYIALSDCNGLEDGQCGLTDGSIPGDWRLPNRRELLSLIEDDSLSPALPFGHPFTNVPPNFDYWSSTTYVFDADNQAWVVDIFNGDVDYGNKLLAKLVWPVRGGQ